MNQKSDEKFNEVAPAGYKHDKLTDVESSFSGVSNDESRLPEYIAKFIRAAEKGEIVHSQGIYSAPHNSLEFVGQGSDVTKTTHFSGEDFFATRKPILEKNCEPEVKECRHKTSCPLRAKKGWS